MLSLQIVTNIFILPRVTLTICKKSILYSQALCLYRICSKNNFFDIHCNNLEKWLSERGYSEKLVCKEILKARSQSRETLLDKEKRSRNDDRVTFNITYYPVFKNIRILLEELHIFLAPDEQNRKVFTDIPRIGFKNGKSLKDHLPHEKINRCLTDINRCLTDIFKI